MTRSKSFVAGLVTLAASAIALFASAAPVVDIDRDRHGNLWAAQKDILAAYQKVDDAQLANNYNLGGHAAKARDLLTQASRELKLAAETANRR